MGENRIQEPWQGYFVDQQIHSVLTSCSSARNRPPTWRTEADRRLSRPDLRASLLRARATFDYPLPDPVSGRRAVLAGHTGRVDALAVTPDESRLASTGDDETVRIWDVEPGRDAMSIRVGHGLRHVVIGGRRVAVAGDRGPYLLAVSAC